MDSKTPTWGGSAAAASANGCEGTHLVFQQCQAFQAEQEGAACQVEQEGAAYWAGQEGTAYHIRRMDTADMVEAPR